MLGMISKELNTPSGHLVKEKLQLLHSLIEKVMLNCKWYAKHNLLDNIKEA